MARSENDPRLADLMTGNALNNLAAIARDEGDHSRAAAYLEDALSRMRAAGIRQGTRMVLGDLGDLARDQGDYARALTFYREALAEAGGSLESREVAEVLEAIGIVAAALGDAERAAQVLGTADAVRNRMGVRLRVHQNQAALDQAVEAVRAELAEAAFDEAWAACRDLPPADADARRLRRRRSVRSAPRCPGASRRSCARWPPACPTPPSPRRSSSASAPSSTTSPRS